MFIGALALNGAGRADPVRIVRVPQGPDRGGREMGYQRSQFFTRQGPGRKPSEMEEGVGAEGSASDRVSELSI